MRSGPGAGGGAWRAWARGGRPGAAGRGDARLPVRHAAVNALIRNSPALQRTRAPWNGAGPAVCERQRGGRPAFAPNRPPRGTPALSQPKGGQGACTHPARRPSEPRRRGASPARGQQPAMTKKRRNGGRNKSGRGHVSSRGRPIGQRRRAARRPRARGRDGLSRPRGPAAEAAPSCRDAPVRRSSACAARRPA
jgi:hypothetical protein